MLSAPHRALGVLYAGLLVVVWVLPVPSYAAPITYHVNRIVGNLTVTGSITTDGTTATGAAVFAALTSWSLVIDSGIASVTLTEANSSTGFSARGSGDNLVLTTTMLAFDFGAPKDTSFSISSNFDSSVWNVASSGSSFGGVPELGQEFASDGQGQFSRVVDIPNLQVIGTVPEPSALALLALTGLALARRRTWLN